MFAGGPAYRGVVGGLQGASSGLLECSHVEETACEVIVAGACAVVAKPQCESVLRIIVQQIVLSIEFIRSSGSRTSPGISPRIGFRLGSGLWTMTASRSLGGACLMGLGFHSRLNMLIGVLSIEQIFALNAHAPTRMRMRSP